MRGRQHGGGLETSGAQLMKMTIKLSLKDTMLPVIVLAFVGVPVTFLAPFFTTNTRWLVLIAVMLYVIATGRMWRPLRTRFAIVTILSCLWSITTVIWSEAPLLSALKSAAFMMVSLTCLVAGYNWSLRTPIEKILDFLMPLTIAALLAGVLGMFSTSSYDYAGDLELYQGLVGGSNMFGSMLAMCAPYLLWKVYHNWGRMKVRLVWLALCFVGLYYLMAASSRGAMMIVFITMAGMFLSLGLRRRVQIFIMSIGAIGIVVIAMPDTLEYLQQKFIYKNASHLQGVFYTRLDPWKISYDKAQQGGLFGGGYGVSIGDKTGEFKFSLTSVKYGREKGNSQLAIVEETGVIGLLLYGVSLFFLFLRLVNAARQWPTGSGKVMMTLTTYLLVGMIAGSCFEAWWVAPGSPESVYFWVMVGVALGLSATRPVLAQNLRKSAAVRRAVLIESPGQRSAAT